MPGPFETLTSDNFKLVLDAYPNGEFRVAKVRGVEQISRPFTFEILLVGKDIASSTFARDLLGQSATLLMGGEILRPIHGIIRRIEAEGTSGGGEGRHRYRAFLAPRLWFLSRNRNSRIFQDKTVRQIIDQLLDESNVERRWNLIRTLTPRNYCVQYQESDLRFIDRLLAEEGIFYSFDHEESGTAHETIVFEDSAEVCKPITGSYKLSFRDSGGMDVQEGDVGRFRINERIRAGSSLLKEFDFLRPSLDLRASAETRSEPEAYDVSRIRSYEHHGEFEGEGVDVPTAARHLEQHRTLTAVGAGESRCRHITPGRWIMLSGAAIPEHDGRYTIYRVEHEGHNPELISGASSATEARDVYKNRFSVLPAKVPLRPKRPKRRLQQVLETATVTGPPGQEIHTDVFGRIKVQFHWDLHGKNDERSSCWIRTMQTWAGTGWGFQFIPRIGMEVLVTFAGGDADRPMVIGCVANAEHPTPFPLPQSKTRSGIRTQSSRGGDGYNELSFEDRKRHEQIHLRAQKDLDELVHNDHRTTVHNNQTVSVGAQQTDIVGGNRILAVSKNRFQTVAFNDALTVGGNLGEEIGGEHIVDIAASESITVGANRDIVVVHRNALVVGGPTSQNIGGSSTTSIAGEASLLVGSNQTVTIGGSTKAFLGTDLELVAGGKIAVASETGITFTCGSTTVEITSSEVKITANSLSITGKDGVSLLGSSASFALDGDVSFLGGNVSLVSSGASITLDSNATIQGSKVALGSGGGQSGSTSQSDKSSTEPPPKLELTVFVGVGSERTADGELALIDESGADIRTVQAADATRTSDGYLVFEIDPDELSGATLALWRTPNRTIHIAGPVDFKTLRDTLHEGDTKRANRLAKGTQRRAPSLNYAEPRPEPRESAASDSMQFERSLMGSFAEPPRGIRHHSNAERPDEGAEPSATSGEDSGTLL